MERSARVLDGSILVIDGVAGVQAQTQTVWKQIKKNNVSTIAFINKMDRDGASFERSLISIEKKLNTSILPIQLPLGSENNFYGVIDLCSMTQVTWGNPNDIISTRTPPKPIYKRLPSYSLLQKFINNTSTTTTTNTTTITTNNNNTQEYSQDELEVYQHAWHKRHDMLESLASIDEILMEKYLSLSSDSDMADMTTDTTGIAYTHIIY